MPPWIAILLSVTLILVFGEVFTHLLLNVYICFNIYTLMISFSVEEILQIMPQAVCTRYGLKIGAIMAPFVRLLLILFFPISYPISKVTTKSVKQKLMCFINYFK